MGSNVLRTAQSKDHGEDRIQENKAKPKRSSLTECFGKLDPVHDHNDNVNTGNQC